MRSVVDEGTAHGAIAGKAASPGRPARPETTNDQRDAVVRRVHGPICCAVWIGFDDMKKLGRGETGGKVAGADLGGLHVQGDRRPPDKDFVQPPGIVVSAFDKASGLLAAAGQETNTLDEVFIDGTAPTEHAAARGGEEASPDKLASRSVNWNRHAVRRQRRVVKKFPPAGARYHRARFARTRPPASELAWRAWVPRRRPDRAAGRAAAGTLDAGHNDPRDAGPPGLLDGLVGHWRLDDGAGSAVAVDSSGRGTTAPCTASIRTPPGWRGAPGTRCRRRIRLGAGRSIADESTANRRPRHRQRVGESGSGDHVAGHFGTALSRQIGTSEDQYYHLSLFSTHGRRWFTRPTSGTWRPVRRILSR
jgi:membrane peptidoglycan carboxypeptidase